MLVDLSLPPNGNEEFGGKEVTMALNKNFPEIKIIILSANNEERIIADLIENGANGYLVKDSNASEVYDAIVAVHTKGSYINIFTLRAIQHNNTKRLKGPLVEDPNTILTPREIEILQLICIQNTTDEIAKQLFISHKTVNTHRINLLEKTKSHNIAGLVLFALKHGIVKI
jgi:DNA-binding NarL/FixJ family response regulator